MTWDFQFLILLNTNSLNSFMFFYHLNSFLKKYSKIPLNSEKKTNLRHDMGHPIPFNSLTIPLKFLLKSFKFL